MTAALLALALSSREAIGTGVLAAFVALLSFASYRRHQRPKALFYALATAFALTVTVMSASGHVFHGW